MDIVFTLSQMIKKISLLLLGLLSIFLVYTISFTEKGVTYKELAPNPNLPDFSKLSEEAAKDLQEYIRIKTVRGNESLAIDFLKNILEKNGVPVQIIIHPKDQTRVNLIAVLKGEKEDGGVIFANHTDVVEVNEKEWEHPPFDGTRVGNTIYGRGAVDMKGLGLMQLYAFLLVKHSGVKLKHNLMYLSLADEETRSEYGAKYLLHEYPDLLKGYEYMHNEGGTGTKDVVVKGSQIFNLQYAEKGIIWLEAEASGESGHGSTPANHYAAKDMLAFINHLELLEDGYTISDVTSSFFYQIGSISPFPNSFVLQRSRNPLLKPILDGVISQNRHLRAMTSNTMSITGINSFSQGINVITNSTRASFDFRILPGVEPSKYIENIQEIADRYKIKLKVLHSEPATVSPIDTHFFRVLAGTATGVVKGSIVTPFMSPGTTDSSYFRATGIKCYGLIPALLSDKEIDGIHGKNESLRVEHLKTGIQILYETILNYNQEEIQ
jgi:acetylornithine deacetylase/succinyl-diaminopimelate desuccinylase-like protein